MGSPVDKQIQTYFQARTALRAAEHDSRHTVSDASDARRVTRQILLENMQASGVDCVPIHDDRSGETKYARVVKKPAKYIRFSSPQDILNLVRDVRDQIQNVSDSSVPRHLVTVAMSRAKEEATTEKRLCVSTTAPPDEKVTSRPPASVAAAGASFVATSREYKQCSAPISELKARVRDSEKKLETFMAPDKPIVVRVEKQDGSEKLVRIENQTRANKPKLPGPRRVSEMIRDAARYAVADRDSFEDRFAHQIRGQFENHLKQSEARPVRSSIRILERQIKEQKVNASANASGSQQRT